MAQITLAQAEAVIDAATAKAATDAMQPLAIVVLDAGGTLIACRRQDGASAGRVAIAIGKAAGALFLGMSSRRIAEMAAKRASFVASLAALAPQGVVPAAGGLVIVDGSGATVGAVGVSGDLSDRDEAAAGAGIAAAGLGEG